MKKSVERPNLVNEIPWATKYLGCPLLLVVEARREQ